MELPFHIRKHRKELCNSCPTPCQYQKDAGFRENADNQCPDGRWQAFKLFKKNVKAIRGLGDVVAIVAEPIAAASDAVLNTKLKGCAACKRRKEMLNHLIPWGQKSPSEF